MLIRPLLKKSKIILVGEAPGVVEEKEGIPFVGSSGALLDKMLSYVGIQREDCSITNVFLERPPSNDVLYFFQKKDKISPYPLLRQGNTVFQLKGEFEGEIQRLKEEILYSDANVVVALGATALWALCGLNGISDYRGRILTSQLVNKKVIPTYHPAAILRNFKHKPVVEADLSLSLKESFYPDIRRITRNIYIATSIKDFYLFHDLYIKNATTLSFDVETDKETKQITCISIAPSANNVLVIPFWDFEKEGKSYWSLDDEVEAILFLKKILESELDKVGQNILYDLSYLYLCSIRPLGNIHDSMLLAHAFNPEMEKDLGFLASLFASEGPWKKMGSKPKSRENKKDQ